MNVYTVQMLNPLPCGAWTTMQVFNLLQGAIKAGKSVNINNPGMG
jgi:hypothetical protein